MNNKLSTILTVTSMAGLATTTALAIHDTLKAFTDIESGKPKKQILKHYIPTSISFGVTGASIIFSDVLNRKQKAALLSTLAGGGLLAASGLKEMIERQEIIIDEDLDDLVWIFEDFRRESEEENAGWFQIRLMDLFAAEYDINRIFALSDKVYLNDFYFYLSLQQDRPRNALGDVYCWDKEFCKWIDFQHQKVVRDDGSYYYILTYPEPPRPDYQDCH